MKPVFQSPIPNSPNPWMLFVGMRIFLELLVIAIVAFVVSTIAGNMNIAFFPTPGFFVIVAFALVLYFWSLIKSERIFRINPDNSISISRFDSFPKANTFVFDENQDRYYLGLSRLTLSMDNIEKIELVEESNIPQPYFQKDLKILVGLSLDSVLSVDEKMVMKRAFLRPNQKSLKIVAKRIRFYYGGVIYLNLKKTLDFQIVEFFVSPKDVSGAYEALKRLDFPVED